MEQLNPSEMISMETSAPALNRGFAILRTLEVESPLSLEALASRLKLPKTSLFRLLETMQEIGCVRKNAEKKYEPLWALKPISDSQTSFAEQLITCMQRLCKKTDCTIEWYETAPEGMRMTRQELPDVEVCIKARPGHVAHWRPEFNAVVQIGLAFAKNAPAPSVGYYSFESNGVRGKISLARVRQELRAVRERGYAQDSAFNMNGVRRWAFPVHRNEQFLGVLAVAESFRFLQPDHSDHYPELIRDMIKPLQIL